MAITERANPLRPIKIFGLVLIGMGTFGAYFSYSLIQSNFFRLSFLPTSAEFFLVLGVLFFHFITGFGVLFLTRWGFVLFKLFLYVLFLAFPLGTIISYLTLRHMKTNQISRYFGFAVQREPPEPRPLAFSAKVTILLLVIGSLALYVWMMISF